MGDELKYFIFRVLDCLEKEPVYYVPVWVCGCRVYIVIEMMPNYVIYSSRNREGGSTVTFHTNRRWIFLARSSQYLSSKAIGKFRGNVAVGV